MDSSLLRLGEFCSIPCVALVSIIVRTFKYNPKGDIGYKQVTDIGREDDKNVSLQLEAVLLRHERKAFTEAVVSRSKAAEILDCTSHSQDPWVIPEYLTDTRIDLSITSA